MPVAPSYTPVAPYEQTYLTMPTGYEVAPDDEDGIAANVIATNTWGTFRLCTATACYNVGGSYGPNAGKERNGPTSGKDMPNRRRGYATPNDVPIGPMWEQGNCQYRIKPQYDQYPAESGTTYAAGTNSDWYRLLIRKQCPS